MSRKAIAQFTLMATTHEKLYTRPFARAFASLTRSLAHSLPSSWDSVIFDDAESDGSETYCYLTGFVGMNLTGGESKGGGAKIPKLV